MNKQEVLDNVLELGYIDTSTKELIMPKFNVHAKERFPIFIKYIQDYLKENPKETIKAYFTLYDAWREHAEPAIKPFFINSTKDLLEHYKGKGSAGEPGRFIQPYKLKELFPIFDCPVLAFGRHKNDPTTILMPDSDFIKFNGYEELRKEIDLNDIEWNDKKSVLFFRGGIHGFPYVAYDSNKPPRCQRKMLTDYSIDKKDWIDAKASYSTTKKEMLQYKYQIDVDGEVNAWSALWWKLYSNSVVFKIESHYEQWYYKDLKEWEHYIPVKADLSDLEEKYKWALENDDKCKIIAETGKEFAKKLTYEYSLKHYKIE